MDLLLSRRTYRNNLLSGRSNRAFSFGNVCYSSFGVLADRKDIRSQNLRRIKWISSTHFGSSFFNANYGGLPLNIGITTSPVSDSLGNLCNDFDESGCPRHADVGPQAQRRTCPDNGRTTHRVRAVTLHVRRKN